MERFERVGTENTPHIALDPAKGVFEFSGRSLPDDARALYEPVVSWIREYAKSPDGATEFMFKMEYINTATGRMLLDIFYALQEIEGARVVWCFLEDDEDMEETGEEFAELVKLPFELRAY